MADPAALRAEFPVLERVSYLNAGTNGPVPRSAVEAAQEAVAEQAETGRGGMDFFMRAIERMEEVRRRVAELIGCTPGELALTGSTTDGVNAVLSALDLRAGDEVLTSDEEHPGVLAPLAAHRERRGLRVRVVPFDSLANEVRSETRLVACSHVSWVTGRVVDGAALSAAGAPVLLDGAQGLGALPLDVTALGCDFYAAAGQKWLCGPNGVGYLYVREERVAGMSAPWPGYGSLHDPKHPLDYVLQEEARRFDMGFPAPHQSAWVLASLDVLGGDGMQAVYERARSLAARLAELLAERGRRVAPRGDSTLVSWEATDPESAVKDLAEQDVVLRDIPGRGYLRASVGAWNDDDDLERVAALAA